MWLLFILALLWPQATQADVVVPTSTTLRIEHNGVPVEQPTDLTVACYGYSWAPGPSPELAPGTYTAEVVYQFSAQCPTYGCVIDEPYYLNYRHVDYCIATATIEGQSYLANIGNVPYGQCDDYNGVRRDCQTHIDFTNTYVSGRAVQTYSFWWAWLVTVMTETVVCLIVFQLVLRKRLSPAVHLKRTVGLGIGLSSITLPYAWFVIPNLPYVAALISGWYHIQTWVVEILVVAVEAILIQRWTKVGKWRALLISLVANAVSFTVGFLWVLYWR